MNLIVSNSAQTSFAISRALNCTDRTDCGAYTNDTRSIVITTVDPGLIAPAPLSAYTNGSDFIKQLPFMRESYMYGVRATNEDGKFRVSPDDKQAVENLRALIIDASEIVFASNGGSESQALFSMVCRYFKVGQHTSRMWLTTLNNRAISLAYRRRESGRLITRIGRSGTVHQVMDFLFSSNVEQAFAECYGKKTFPMQRMDIAALWLLCNSYDQHKVKHPSKTTYTFSVSGDWNGNLVSLAPTGLWYNADKAECYYERLNQKMGATVTAEIIGTTDHCDRAGDLYDMPSLQYWALIVCGFMPERTMAVADALYEKGLISSPRTSVPVLSAHMKKHIERRYPEAGDVKFWADESIPYCHGILTTERTPLFLTEDEQSLYRLISFNEEKVFSAPKRYTEVEVSVVIAGVELYGSVEMPYGYRPEADTMKFKVNGVGKSTLVSKQPEPLTAVEFLHDFWQLMIDGPEVAPILPFSNYNDCGACLQRLVDNGFAKIILGDIKPTEKARVLMAHTAHLELADIGTFISQINEVDELADNRKPTLPVVKAYEDWLEPQIRTLITDPKVFKREMTDLKCPMCGNHGLATFPATVTCECCGFNIPRFFKGHQLTAKDIEQLCKYKYTSPIYDFIDSRGKKFTESLVINARHGISFAAKEAKIY